MATKSGRTQFAPTVLFDRIHKLCRGIQHIFNKDAVACRWVVDEDMGHRADELAVLDNGTAAHADVKYGTNKFCVFLRFYAFLQVKGRLLHIATAILNLT